MRRARRTLRSPPAANPLLPLVTPSIAPVSFGPSNRDLEGAESCARFSLE